MKGFTVMMQIGICGFGWNGGSVPELRLGVVLFACCHGRMLDALGKMRAALEAAQTALEEQAP